MTAWRQLRTLPKPVQLLLINQFTINAAFYMLMPFLADYLSVSVGLAGWAIGLVLGLRNLSQQGMFFLGGLLADRFGYKALIMAGCALRVIAFGLLAVAGSLPLLLVASALTGLAGALFNPAVRAYVADESGPCRLEAFSAFNMFYQAGLLGGPLIGVALLRADFSVVCLVAAALFAVLTLVQARYLPDRGASVGVPHSMGGTVGGGALRQAATNRTFWIFAVAMAGTTLLTYQTYLVLPLYLRSAAVPGSVGIWVAALFVISGVTTIATQSRLTRRLRERSTPRTALVWSALLAAAAFLPVALASAVGSGTTLLAAALLAGGLLGLASAVSFPFEMGAVVTLSKGRGVATHFGLYGTVAGIAVVLGNLGVGAVLDATGRTGVAFIPAILLVAVGLGGALVLRRLPTLCDPDERAPEVMKRAAQAPVTGRPEPVGVA
ncbi:MAG: MFS transporter [Mycobacteriales bacterium]